MGASNKKKLVPLTDDAIRVLIPLVKTHYQELLYIDENPDILSLYGGIIVTLEIAREL